MPVKKKTLFHITNYSLVSGSTICPLRSMLGAENSMWIVGVNTLLTMC
jgi:hypothetical protein